jgi:hypothetical protein
VAKVSQRKRERERKARSFVWQWDMEGAEKLDNEKKADQ